MASNDREYEITKQQVERFEQALVAFDQEDPGDLDPMMRKVQRDAMESQLADLRAEVAEYERRR